MYCEFGVGLYCKHGKVWFPWLYDSTSMTFRHCECKLRKRYEWDWIIHLTCVCTIHIKNACLQNHRRINLQIKCNSNLHYQNTNVDSKNIELVSILMLCCVAQFVYFQQKNEHTQSYIKLFEWAWVDVPKYSIYLCVLYHRKLCVHCIPTITDHTLNEKKKTPVSLRPSYFKLLQPIFH